MTVETKRGKGRQALYIAFSVLVACLIWLYVDSSSKTESAVTVSDIPIEYIGKDTTLADRGLMLLPDSDQTVTLELRALRRVVAKLDPDKIRVQADLSNITATGAQTINYRIFYPSAVSSNNVTVVRASSYTVRVDIGELYSRDVNIHCALAGTGVAEGYIAGEVQCSPATLEIRGQQEYVDQVAYARVTLDVNNATGTVSKSLAYKLYDAKDNLIEDTSNLHATVDQIQVTLPVNVIKELPLKMSFKEGPGARISNLDYAISPAAVTVSGDADLLQGVNEIVLDNFDLTAFSTPTTYNYAIPIPEGCENLSGSTRATLTIRFKDMLTRTLTATDFQCENIPDGKTVTVLTAELPITVRGISADVAALTNDDVSLLVDLKDVTASSGSYTVEAQVKIRTNGDVGSVGNYQARVTIEDAGSTASPEESPNTPETPDTNG